MGICDLADRPIYDERWDLLNYGIEPRIMATDDASSPSSKDVKMKLVSGLVGCCLLFVGASVAHAQLMFDTTLDKVAHPKSDWERWASTQVGDFIEYSDGKN